MINCLIIDDAPVARDILVTYCQLIPALQIVGVCTDAFDARDKLQQTQAAGTRVDLLFLDINMPMLSGIEWLKTLKNPPSVIFTTAYKEFATEAFDLAACDYLLKPFSIERFIIAIDRVLEKVRLKSTPQSALSTTPPINHLLIRTEGRLNKLNHDQILFLEASRNSTKVFALTETLLSTTPLSSMELLLPADIFFRVHRSFIVNLSNVTSLQGNRIFLGKSEVPLGGNYKEEFLRILGL